MTPSATASDANKALVLFLRTVLGASCDVIMGQVNRTPTPATPDYVVYWPLRRPRLSTNVDTMADTKFTGSIAGLLLTVTDVAFGTIVPGATLFGVGVAAGTVIGAQASGTPGGVGTYAVTIRQVLASGTLSCGATQLTQGTEVVYQCDVHGPSSADNAQVISTTWRDDYAVTLLASTVGVPLYADDPQQLQFLDDQQQVEFRWTVDLHMQINPTVSVPQQYADAVEIGLIDVDAVYPP